MKKEKFKKLFEIQKLRKIEVFITRFCERSGQGEWEALRRGEGERRESGETQTKRARRKDGKSEEIKIIVFE